MSRSPTASTALHWAAYTNDSEIADLLIRAGANAKATNRYGVTPLALASTNGNAAIIEALVKAGADPNLASAEGETPLMLAARSGIAPAVKRADRPRRERQRDGKMERPDGADVGRGGRPRGGGAGARRGRRRPQRPFEGRPDALPVCGP